MPLNAHGKYLVARLQKRDRGLGAAASFQMIRTHLLDAHLIELYPSSRTVVLVVPFSDLRHSCTELEWLELRADLDRKGIPVMKWRWWQFWH
jgi:hypothetical protein